MTSAIHRRAFLLTTATGAAAASLPNTTSAVEPKPSGAKFKYGLNTSTIREQKLGIVKEVELASQAGFDGIEPWINQLEQYVRDGGDLKDLRKRISDSGLKVYSAIGFANWVVDDDEKRKAGLEQAKRDMDLVLQIGGTHIAAPPAGATNQTDLNLMKAAERYRALLEVGDAIGIIPQVEVWGFSKSLSRLGETALVATEAQHPRACILPDVYHLYKGGSDFEGVKLLSSHAMHCFHVNDYPADPPRASIADKHRVYPGDGIAPLKQVYHTLAQAGFEGMLSLELFNPTYWAQDAKLVVETGIRKMRESVAKAFA